MLHKKRPGDFAGSFSVYESAGEALSAVDKIAVMEPVAGHGYLVSEESFVIVIYRKFAVGKLLKVFRQEVDRDVSVVCGIEMAVAVKLGEGNGVRTKALGGGFRYTQPRAYFGLFAVGAYGQRRAFESGGANKGPRYRFHKKPGGFRGQQNFAALFKIEASYCKYAAGPIFAGGDGKNIVGSGSFMYAQACAGEEKYLALLKESVISHAALSVILAGNVADHCKNGGELGPFGIIAIAEKDFGLSVVFAALIPGGERFHIHLPYDASGERVDAGKSIFLTYSQASFAPKMRSIPQSSHSTESGPS